MTRAALSLLLLAACSSTAPGADASGVDGAGPPLEACLDGLAPRVSGRWVGTLGFESTDGSTRLLLAREPGDRPFVGETFPYDLVRFAIERDGNVECIAAPALSYEFGHHNWDDLATAEGAHTYVVQMRFPIDPPGWIDTLTIDGGAPIALRNTSCAVIPPGDLNHCLSRSPTGG